MGVYGSGRCTLTGLLLSLLLLSCQQHTPAQDVLRIGMPELPATLDPRYATDAASHKVHEFLHRGLVHLDDHFRPQPDLALSWEHPGPLLWRFTLKQGMRFHDGQNVQAEDVVATLNSILDEHLASPLRAGFAAIERMEVTSPQQLTIHLNKPDSSFLTRLSVGILPALLAVKPQQAQSIIGAGPFSLLSWQDNDLRLRRATPLTQANRVNTLHFVRVKDAVTRCLKLVRGEIDFIQNDLPPHLLPYLKKQPNLQLATRASTTFSYVGLNMQDEILDDVRVRHALALALDRERLKRALLSDLPLLAESILTPDHWASTALTETLYAPEQAKKLLDEAGFPVRADGTRFHLVYRTSTDPTRLQLATAFAAMWQEIGVDVSIESLEWGGFYARIKRGDFQLFSLSWVSIVDPDIYRWILHSDMWPPKGANRGRYANQQMDTWLEKASEMEDVQSRKELYALIQQQMQSDQVYIPLWFEPVIAVSGPRLRGFLPTPDGSLSGLADVQLLAQ
ncbi:MAG: ABC transporter substrate-binding protein [Zetaproteobacteria bacterium CG_4_9_14_3_um_filter_49_83]|nr:MAG: ABC transporter substrate-binding protein [Zetaproteobacteria bacterium CG1_02_49_23]PIQ33988.1 MAG: ABC transporter substrate-binding protein [Zetaproteobacteria bacterium CG17_big_fil_post_rev_8_21_14_2_50_50_13]PIV30539.1 MAG: ABC transporter substrate-binding protein [Zetaproteobacteria bacterium CG02_land_8_20_14_3_00_50_9]PIY56503.1 MAG: ABC transporter substrate-binding protein [Zetaproteobacteria bacterium CG_4_10_14_0_8_um_filter_49_80]PJA33801.1 MAG: ABC transporter substrate-